MAWADEDGGELAIPVLSESKHGTFISVRITGGGSSAESLDVVIRRVDRHRWIKVDAASWRRESERRVPRPLYARANASLDLANLNAELTLMRLDDLNCCPTRGRAEVQIVLRNDVLVVDGVTFRPATRPSSPAVLTRQGTVRRQS